MNKPESAADPRPNNEPYYIDSDCQSCGAEIVLEDEELPEEETWHDEWRCPGCGNLYLDWPQKELEKLVERKEEDEYVKLEEV
jgi:uncharacterized protein with PIN domain